MRAIAILAAAAGLVTLAGCDRLGGGGTAGNATNGSANASTAARAGEGANQAQGADAAGGKLNEGGGAVPAASGAPQLDRTFLLGRWTDDGDCDSNTLIEFTQDGRFLTANGGTGLWNLEGDQLTMTGRDTATIRIVPIDQDTMTVVNNDGSLGRSTRC